MKSPILIVASALAVAGVAVAAPAATSRPIVITYAKLGPIVTFQNAKGQYFYVRWKTAPYPWCTNSIVFSTKPTFPPKLRAGGSEGLTCVSIPTQFSNSAVGTLGSQVKPPANGIYYVRMRAYNTKTDVWSAWSPTVAFNRHGIVKMP